MEQNTKTILALGAIWYISKQSYTQSWTWALYGAVAYLFMKQDDEPEVDADEHGSILSMKQAISLGRAWLRNLSARGDLQERSTDFRFEAGLLTYEKSIGEVIQTPNGQMRQSENANAIVPEFYELSFRAIGGSNTLYYVRVDPFEGAVLFHVPAELGWMPSPSRGFPQFISSKSAQQTDFNSDVKGISAMSDLYGREAELLREQRKSVSNQGLTPQGADEQAERRRQLEGFR